MKNRIAYVTGGMGGIGTAICRKLHEKGCRVIAGCSPRRDYRSWLDVQKAAGFDFGFSVADVTSGESVSAAFSQLKSEVGEVDILINNAGITRDSSFMKMTPKQWQEVMDTNLNGLFYTTQAVLKGMTSRGWGRIINISSVNARRGQYGQVNYSAAKAGIYGFTKSLACEVASKGVTVNSISPGYTATNMVEAMPAAILQKIVSSVPQGRLGLPEETAAAAAFIASDDAAFITGANLDVNGGLYMG